MLNIKDLLLDSKYLRNIATTESHLNEVDIKVLYKMGFYEIFLNENITIPKEVLLDYTKSHFFCGNDDRKFFLRKDVSNISEDIINTFIESYVTKWTDRYLKRNGGGAAYYLPEIACSYLAEDLEHMQTMGVSLTEANISTLMKYECAIKHFKEGRFALEKIMNNK